MFPFMAERKRVVFDGTTRCSLNRWLLRQIAVWSSSIFFAPPWDDMMLIADRKDHDRVREILFSTLRLAPCYINCDYATFVRHIYGAGLRREPEDGVSHALPLDAGNVYNHRVNYLHAVLSSEENRLAGYDAIIWAIPDLLGSRNRVLVADMIRHVYPTITELVAGLETLMNHVQENSRRQDMILASVTGARR